jgi:fatty-acyl-CoA synthase
MFVYIGELCRYLVNAEPHPEERNHKLRMAFGNGLRGDVWAEMVERFAIPEVLEFYGATEGNVSMFNFDNTVGAIGRIPKWLKKRVNARIVQFDIESEQPIRSMNGLCIECGPGQVGECIGKIDAGDPRTSFTGYADKAATEKKVLHDVFEKGDAWFRTGDLMRQDADGYIYFVDRIGDTFRWKGENVATSEVAEVISVDPGVDEANVYGVAIPGQDGRAGMAALVVNADFDLDRLSDAIHRGLAAYARPLFLRILPEMEITGTFKHRKVDLVREGFDPRKLTDALYFRDAASGRYVPLDAARYEAITSGRERI